MRKFNAGLSAVILVLFLIHAVEGSFQLLGFRPASGFMKALAWINTGLILVHMLIGIKFTIGTIKVSRNTGTSYRKLNALFWARRVSGSAVMLFLLFHVTAFGTREDGIFRLARFTRAKLISQILMVLSIAVHVITNIRPLMTGLGIPKTKARSGDILLVLSVLLLFSAAALFFYYYRWNRV